MILVQILLAEIIRKADSDDLAPHVRDGYMMMFIYMPSVFEDAFVPYIGQIINPILRVRNGIPVTHSSRVILLVFNKWLTSCYRHSRMKTSMCEKRL